MIRLFLSLCLSAMCATTISAQYDPFSDGGGTKTVAAMVPEAKAIVPGKPLAFALELKHPENWHSYYLNSGGVELSPEIKWELPPGFTAGPIEWPVPGVKDGYGGKSLVYEGTVVLLVEVTAPADAKPGETVTLTAKATWQICSQGCQNENQDFKFTLPVAASADADPAQAGLFKRARAKFPVTNDVWSVEAFSASKAADVILRLTPKAGAKTPASLPTEFVPNPKFLQPISAGGKVEKDGTGWKITLKRAVMNLMEEAIPQGDSLSGIIVCGKPGAPDYAALMIGDTPIGKEGAASAKGRKTADALPLSRYLLVLGGMLLGGLILNLMPCVFPVIGLKIMSFVQQAGEDRKKIVAHGLLFTLGVMVSFGVLSGILFAAREAAGKAGGEEINWGYQLQNPWVVMGLMLLMFTLALNMFGLFEIGTSATSVGGSLQSKGGLIGSFFSGVLATVVATPCSAPFLGAAIGAAIALPPLQFFLAFGAMALGLSLPYLLLSLFPQLVEMLPRPGAWMESFKQGMSFLLFATAGYLLWVYLGQIDLENMLGPVFGLTGVAVAAWVYGRWCLPHRKAGVRRAGAAVALAFALGGVFLTLPPVKAKLEWEPWSQARAEALLKEGKPVYIDFTAKWCLTCQVNKKRAYTPEVVALMKEKGVVALRADKTNPSPEIDAKMRELGRSAIPVNVLLVPGKDPVITPEVLSPAYLDGLFRKEIPDKGGK